MRTKPLPVTVVIPAFNRETLIRDALASVAAQTPSLPAEVIVVDDCSTDDTAAVAERLGARVLRHRENTGAAAARNTGIAAANQEWVALLDSDDEWLPHHLDTLWRHRHGHALVAGAALADADDGSRPRYHGTPSRGPHGLDSPATILYPENFIAASGALVRTDAVRDAGGYDTSLRYAEDFDLWIRLLERWPGIALPVVVYRWRTHPGQKSKGSTTPREIQRQIVRSYAGRPWWSAGLAQRRLAVAEWDDLRLAITERRGRDAAHSAVWLLARPGRLAGVIGLLGWRFRLRRRSASLARRSQALLLGTTRSGRKASADMPRASAE